MDTKDDKKKRTRKPARFVIQLCLDDVIATGDVVGAPTKEAWVDVDIPEKCEPLDSTDKCQRIINDELDDGIYRVNHVKKQLIKETKKVDTTTITDIK